MKIKTLLLVAGCAAFLLSDGSASIDRVIVSSSENAVQINSARVVRAIGGGSYVTGMVELSFGYSNPRSAHVHIAAYDMDGKLLAEKIDKISANKLQRWHLRPAPRTPYVAFFPWEPSQIAKVTVTEHGGHEHPAS